MFKNDIKYMLKRFLPIYLLICLVHIFFRINVHHVIIIDQTVIVVINGLLFDRENLGENRFIARMLPISNARKIFTKLAEVFIFGVIFLSITCCIDGSIHYGMPGFASVLFRLRQILEYAEVGVLLAICYYIVFILCDMAGFMRALLINFVAIVFLALCFEIFIRIFNTTVEVAAAEGIVVVILYIIGCFLMNRK